MKHNLLKSVIISVILLMGVSNAWGKTVNGPRIYFDNSSMNMTSTQVYFVVGHNSFSRTYGPMTEISDTKLLYRDISKETYYDWGDATYVGFIQVGSRWGDGSWGSSNLKNATNYTAANTSWNSFDWQNTYYCKATSKGGAVSINYKSAGYSGIPKYNATQAAKLRNDITSSYATVNGTWPTTLKLQGTYLSGDGASARSEISGTASSNAESNRVYGAVVTGKITHTYNTITGNYIFEGWGTGDTPSTTNDSYEYNITANTTVYAFFTKAYTVTFDKKGESGSSSVSATATANSTTKAISSGTKVAAGSTIKLTANPASGYRVVGWYSDANCTNQLQNGGNTYNAGTLTAAKTVYVKFEETKYDVTIQAGANGSVSPSGVKKVGNITALTIEATADDGYEFVNWTKTGNITITKANNATTTIKATETGTVTANFRKIEYTTVYLKPGGWASDDARFAVYAFVDGDINEWYDMTPVGCSKEYYQCDISKKYTKVIFVRMNPDKTENVWDSKWNQTSDLTVGANNIWTFTGWDSNSDGKDEGTWEVGTPTYPVTLDPHAVLAGIDFGSYSVRCNGTTYTSHPTEYVTFYAPAGAQIEILGGKPKNDAYYARTRAQQGGASGEIVGNDNVGLVGQTIEVCGSVSIDSWFLTKDDHIVYLGIPTSGNAFNKWNANNGDGYYIWAKDSPFDGLVSSTGEPFVIGNIKYYTFIMPAGTRNIQFQRKGSNTSVSAKDLPYQIPTTNVNCFTLTSENDGYWDMLPTQKGDYRLLYVEQVVEKDADGYTIITRKKAHPSDIIRKGTARQIVSLHTYKERTYTANAGGGLTYESSNNPEIILQKYNENGQWEDVECQMVYGPIETIPAMGQLPGRKNANSNSPIDDLKLHNGIEIIKQDVLTHQDQGNGVWNFVVTQDNDDNASVQWNQTHRYEGKYYIRTDVANGGWNNYTASDNYMTYSQYAKDHSGFSHYFCRWVEKNITPNTKFVIANDYGIAISDTLAQDAYTNEHGDIAHDANIRWSWNMVNNEIARAYIQGTWDVQTSTRNRNLVVNYKSSSTAADQEALLDDSGDWIYQRDFPVKVGSHLNSLTAQYPVSTGSTQTFASNLDMLTGNPANTNEYKVRILYDFKINKTLVALVPDNGKQADIAIDVIIERVDQGPATQVQAQVNATRNEGSTVYAVMSFTKGHIKGDASKYAKQFYWISFPFNVRVSDVFGFGEYGKHWIIQWYDGAERAKNGCWIDSPTYWKFQTDTTDYVLEAGKGYVLTLDLAEMDVFANTNQVSLYFPSRNTVKTVDGEIIHELNTTTLAPYTCTIQRNDRYIKDSHWHMLGVPSYANKNKSFTQNNVAYFYQYNSANDTYTPTSSGSFNFNSMFSYMVQFAGTINWSQFTFAANGSQGLAAKRNTDNANNKHVLRLELQKNNASVDQTFVQLQAEEATEMFDMNLDLTKMINSGSNIYSLIPGTESNIEVAANAMPIAETIIPLGVVSAAAGEYTFAMPEGTDGITVELIDYETNTRTNMLLDEYTVNLGKGTFETRFALHVKPDKTATGVENITTPSHSDVRKFIIDGILYMQKDGALYDAQGHIVR